MFRLGYESGRHIARALEQLVRGGEYASVASAGYLPSGELEITVSARASEEPATNRLIDFAAVDCATHGMHPYVLWSVTPLEVQAHLLVRDPDVQLAARLTLRYEVREGVLATAPLHVEAWLDGSDHFVDGFSSALDAELDVERAGYTAAPASFDFHALGIEAGRTVADLLAQKWRGTLIIEREPGDDGFSIDTMPEKHYRPELSCVWITATRTEITLRVPSSAWASQQTLMIFIDRKARRWEISYGTDITDAAVDVFVRGVRTGLGPTTLSRFEALSRQPEELT